MYSTIVVIDSLLKNEEIDKTIEQIERSIKNNGGEILEIERLGKKRLAYIIKKRQYGYYVEIVFKASGDTVKVIEREYGLDENILRYLTIKLDRKILQYRAEQVEKEKNKEKKAEIEEEKLKEKEEKKKEVVVPS